ncbi:MAG: hypothetical protein WAM67_02150, partial [Candidatus Acidiferrales bacterium]
KAGSPNIAKLAARLRAIARKPRIATEREKSRCLYLNCTLFGRSQRRERQERHPKSASYTLSVRQRGSIPTRASSNFIAFCLKIFD